MTDRCRGSGGAGLEAARRLSAANYFLLFGYEGLLWILPGDGTGRNVLM